MSDSQVHFGGPDRPVGLLRDLLAERVAAVPAGGSIDWVTYYFRDRRLAAALVEAHERGVDVRVTLDGHPRTPHANAAVIEMLEAGLGDRLRVVRGRLDGTPLGKISRPRLHEKLYCFSHPAPVAFVGSFNPSGDVPESTSAVAEDRAPIADAATGVESGTAAAIEPLAALHLDLGEEREIEAAALPAGEPILLSLAVPIVTDGVGTLPVRLIAEDGRVLESPGSVRDDDRERAEVAIEPDWLNRPGRYIVEVRTTEKTHLPLRRYAIRVR